MSEENKLCPFCGGVFEILLPGKGYCITERCRLKYTLFNVEDWNRRFHPPGTPQNPHTAGTDEAPTKVHKLEWFIHKDERLMLVGVASKWIYVYDGDVFTLDTPIHGFEFVDHENGEVRP